ncbi:LLM class flavin-dependent oxidoreductase [Paraliobacillus sediminis]|uniref:LLM class flavin-dependent oxidoreductase n=1 Tax=Paraliobacillus sediminis TaxID=1885916 RepID=UPI000E3D1CD4|nr:LLM class flavin-dependent oxidoreductase [Paraliobacillus sediminis]
MRLSVLDQVPISQDSSPEEAIDNTIKLAKITEDLGFTRYWVAEHHNTNGLASSSPEILMTRLASETASIRIGSGGVLLPQYAPLKVAENFRMLEVMYPNRIDLGLGRSPGGSNETRLALTDHIQKSMSLFPRQLEELYGFLYDELPKDHPFFTVKASPRTKTNPPIWVLGLSERGATNAANIGAGFTYGHFINPTKGKESIAAYKDKFKPNKNFQEPQVTVCIFVICAETEEKSEELALSQDLWLLRVEKGIGTRVPSVEEAKSKTYTKEEQVIIDRNRKRCIVGTPESVKKQLEEIQVSYDCDEFMIITNIYSFEEKVNSYQLLAKTLFN